MVLNLAVILGTQRRLQEAWLGRWVGRVYRRRGRGRGLGTSPEKWVFRFIWREFWAVILEICGRICINIPSPDSEGLLPLVGDTPSLPLWFTPMFIGHYEKFWQNQYRFLQYKLIAAVIFNNSSTNEENTTTDALQVRKKMKGGAFQNKVCSRNLLSPVCTIQPVVKPVWQPVWHWQPAVSCIQPVVSRLYNPVWQPVERTVAVRSTRLLNRLYNRIDNRLDVCLHDTAGCQTGCTTGLTTDCIV